MRLIGQVLLVAVVIGMSVSVAATERIDVSLVLSGTLGWSFVPLLQLLTGLVLVHPRRKLNALAALEAYFSTHVPWSLWILGIHALLLVAAPARDAALWTTVSAVIPAVLTVRLLLVVCRGTLGMPPAVAWRQVLLHQAFSYTLVVLYLDFAMALRPRFLP